MSNEINLATALINKLPSILGRKIWSKWLLAYRDVMKWFWDNYVSNDTN